MKALPTGTSALTGDWGPDALASKTSAGKCFTAGDSPAPPALRFSIYSFVVKLPHFLLKAVGKPVF